ncbi:hypothetical protein ASF40_12615 [Microbacterium sp. Leaf288]|nr:hypothetical protein ASF40_12615 [Microbacterium sp. Leaf288]MDR7111412.1 hypothetical protein [Microbacterium trichothecenolyticum]
MCRARGRWSNSSWLTFRTSNTPEPGTDAAYLADGWVAVIGLDPVSSVKLDFLGTRAALHPR